jgi:CxxC-x17-CxxC domain-containing protein
MEFMDRVLKCSDCGNDFIFTAGEQLFFFDRQFKNDPKRCKLCKAKRAGLGRSAEGNTASPALPLSRTETRTECSACGVETTVPFKPTQGRPVFCRSCFQLKRVPAAVAKVASMDTPELAVEQAVAQVVASGELPRQNGSSVDNLVENAVVALPEVPASQLEIMAADAAQA